jgi:hypothetical protein
MKRRSPTGRNYRPLTVKDVSSSSHAPPEMFEPHQMLAEVTVWLVWGSGYDRYVAKTRDRIAFTRNIAVEELTEWALPDSRR